jgi:hypothetical protein
MSALYHSERGIQIYHGDSIADGLPCECDLLCVDAPYSARTHAAQDSAIDVRPNGAMAYSFWTPRNVRDAVNAWAPSVRGWMVSITDDALWPHWAAAFKGAGRYVFAALPWFSPGSRVRLAGDGPSSWTCWIVVSRPRHPPYSKWGTLPGGYVTSPEKQALVGGKPRRLMLSLVADYSRPGDVVCDPCCGAGTTLFAARDLGRTAVGIDISEEHCAMAAGCAPLATDGPQRTLFG